MRKGFAEWAIDLWVYILFTILLLLFFAAIKLIANPHTAIINAVQTTSFEQKKLEAFLEMPYQDENYNTKVWQALAQEAELIREGKQNEIRLNKKTLSSIICSWKKEPCIWKLTLNIEGRKHPIYIAPVGEYESASAQTTKIPLKKGIVEVTLKTLTYGWSE
ncbi:hypothetical protein HY486_02815 [Candidatus Woesearchaeota archaeon]|nr:hypothetical protein [Candidatus Woesearchaeota archaeon]